MYDLTEYNRGEYMFYLDHMTAFGDVYEFGVFGGLSLEFFIKEAEKFSKSYRKIFGFDSFQGLPVESGDVKILAEWSEGRFNSQTLYDCGVEEVKQHILKRTKNIPTLIGGWFSDTLTKDLVVKYDMQPASYINIDVDLYISTCQVLDFIFQNGLWQDGTMIRYDDWTHDPSYGETKAHMEKVAEYGIKADRVMQHIPHLFRLKK